MDTRSPRAERRQMQAVERLLFHRGTHGFRVAATNSEAAEPCMCRAPGPAEMCWGKITTLQRKF